VHHKVTPNFANNQIMPTQSAMVGARHAMSAAQNPFPWRNIAGVSKNYQSSRRSSGAATRSASLVSLHSLENAEYRRQRKRDNECAENWMSGAPRRLRQE